VVGDWYFGGPKSFGPSYEKPPENPEARKVWISENLDNMSKEFIAIDQELPSWKELDKMNQSLLGKKNIPAVYQGSSNLRNIDQSG